jgi:tetratricopeptide (TPR) repeat protein
MVAEVMQIKKFGNEAFATGDYSEAYSVYQAALDIINEKCGLGLANGLECGFDSRMESDLRTIFVDLQNNSAILALKMAEAMVAHGDDTEAVDAFRAAADAAQNALFVDAVNEKANLRLTRAQDGIYDIEKRQGRIETTLTARHM